MDQADSSEASQTAPIKTKKLFITGLSFYTFEKTIRTAFEGFGELVEEYTTDEAASTALKEMNGKEIYRALWIRRAQILQKQVKQPL